MATYIALIDLTRQGVSEFQNSAQRADAFGGEVKAMGVEVERQYWTLGESDGVLIFKAPDDQTAAAAMLKLTAGGYVRTNTMRAFDRSEIDQVIAKAP